MCNCTFCQNYDKYKWAVVMECKCGCHDEKGITAHDEFDDPVYNVGLYDDDDQGWDAHKDSY